MSNSTIFLWTFIFLLVLAHVLFVGYFIFQYGKILTPYWKTDKEYDTDSEKILKKYFEFHNIKNIPTFKYNEKASIYKNIYNTTTFEYRNLPIWTPYQINGFTLDYLLAQAFIYTSKISKRNNIVFFIFWLYYAPFLFLVLGYSFLVITIIFNILVSQYPDWLSNDFVYKLHSLNIFHLITILFFLLYLLSLGINKPLKIQLEHLYEKDTRKFVETNFSEIYNEWLNARYYSISSQFTYYTGYNFLFRKVKRYVGPFGIEGF